MKSICRNILLLSIVFIVPFSLASCQERKTEKKIKVVIDDGSGSKTVIDTTFTNGSIPDSVMLKSGEVIYVGESGKESDIAIPEKRAEKVFVTVSSGDKDENNKEETVIVRMNKNGNTTKTITGDGKKHVYVYTDTESSSGKPESHVIVSSAGDKKIKTDGDKIIIVKDGKVIENGEGKHFDVEVNASDNDSEIESTKYVIAKDGVVVTVESSDEAKAKELVKEIENKLGVKNEVDENKEAVKSETKKTIKK